MPWSHPSPMDQNTPCSAAYLRDRLAMTERGEVDGVSRQTGDTWLDRDLTHGPQGLAARSRRPSPSPRHTPDEVVAASLAARPRHPSWGAKTLVSILRTRHPRWPWPARSSGCDSLRRHGVVPKTRQRRTRGHPGPPRSHLGAPNAVWSADCTGHLKPGDGRSGDPLTIADGDRRLRRSGPALSSTSVAAATPVFTRVCNACGRPKRRRPDHGVPCATNPRARLSPWAAWWVRLGLFPQGIEPGTPPPNGRPERLPRPLNADTTRPPAAHLRAPPRQCNPGRAEFTAARPHEALDRRTPAPCDEPAPRPMPHTRPPLAYPARCAVRYVSATGGSRWHQPWGTVSTTGAGAYVGLEELADGVWPVSFGPLTRGRLLARERRLAEAYGRRKRHR